jgi:glycerophosphoryl diester phosphodiesterase
MLRAFDWAIEMGTTMLEMDIHLSQDGHPVVIHDADLSRVAGSSGRILDMTLEQINALLPEVNIV